MVMDPLPFIAALSARTAEIGISAIFFSISITASVLLEELGNRAYNMTEDCSGFRPSHFLVELEHWRQHYILICQFVDEINIFFGPILLMFSAIGFAVPIFEFNKILQTRNYPHPRYYFEFIHSIVRFLVILVPSYLVSQQVLTS